MPNFTSGAKIQSVFFPQIIKGLSLSGKMSQAIEPKQTTNENVAPHSWTPLPTNHVAVNIQACPHLHT